MQNVVLFTGGLLIYGGLITALILYLLDYKKILSETFDLSLLEFISRKESRLKSWKSTPLSYHFILIMYILGLLLLILGNTSLIHELRTPGNIIIYIVANLLILFIAGFIGEYYFRKRYRKKHQPLLQQISELKHEIKRD